MIFTIGLISMMIGFGIGHALGEPRVSDWNKYDYAGSVLFVFGFFSALSSVFTITWRYMP